MDDQRLLPIWELNQCRLTKEGQFIQNPTRYRKNAFSCSVDSMVNLVNYGCLDYMTKLERGNFKQMSELAKLFHDHYEKRTEYETLLREFRQSGDKLVKDIFELHLDLRIQLTMQINDLWDWLVYHDGANFATPYKGTDLASVDNVLSLLLGNSNANLFTTKINSSCDCNQKHFEYKMCPILLSGSESSICGGFKTVLESLCKDNMCNQCQSNVSIKEVTVPKFFVIETAINAQGRMNFAFSNRINIEGTEYEVTAMLKHTPGHFQTIAKLQNGQFAVLNDMLDEPKVYHSCLDALNSFRTRAMQGVMYLVYRKMFEGIPLASTESFKLSDLVNQTIDSVETQQNSCESPKLQTEQTEKPKRGRKPKRKATKEKPPAFVIECDFEPVVKDKKVEQKRQAKKWKSKSRENMTESQRLMEKETNKKQMKENRMAETEAISAKRRKIHRKESEVSRSQETAEQTEKRRSSVKRQMSATRSQETAEQTEKRRSTVKRQVSKTRSQETAEQTEKRRSTVKRQVSKTRSQETAEQTEKRRSTVKRQVTKTRSQETVEQTEKRRSTVKRQVTKTRSQETAEQTEKRRSTVKRQVSKTRSQETAEQTEKRRSTVKRQVTKTRSQETVEQTEKRRSTVKRQVTKTRSQETAEQTEKRRSTVKRQVSKTRSQETAEQTEKRRSTVKRQVSKTRSQETAEQTEKRRSTVKRQVTKTRSQETAEQTEKRRSTVKRQVSKTRSQETAEQTEKRRSTVKRQVSKTRSQETAEQTEKRRSTVKRQVSKTRSQETVEQTETRQNLDKCKKASKRTKLETIEQELKTSMSEIPDDHCGCCRKILFPKQCYPLLNCTNLAQRMQLQTGSVLCLPCRTSISRNKMPVKCFLNQLELDNIPDVLKDLTFLEKRFICRVQIYMTLLSLPSGGQYAQEGLAVHFPSEPTNVLTILPSNMQNSGVICVSGNYEAYIRPKLILSALLWLKENNELYSDIDIDWNALPVTEEDVSEALKQFIQSGVIAVDYEMPKISFQEFLKSGGDKVQFPRSSEPPLSYSDTHNAEALGFPWLFPKGRYHSDTPRSKEMKLTLLQYIQSRLLNVDHRFRTDIPYLICSVNRFEQLRLKQLVDLYMNVRKTVKLGDGQSSFQPVTAGDILSLPNNPDLAKNSTMFMKTVRGTSAYWKDALADLLAKMRTLGPPDLFLTFSVDDLHWPELRAAIEHDLQKKVANMADGVKLDPVIVAMYAHHRFLAILKYIKQSNVLGKVTDYYGRTEFQNRGSCHYHLFTWIENCPNLHKGSTAAEVCEYIDSVISTQLPNDDEEFAQFVASRQTHNHSFTCRQKGGRCRFNYPRRECEETRILYQSDNKLKKRGQFYETKRSKRDEMLNAYNAKIIKRYGANMDIQPVNGKEGLAFYVCKYVLKAEPDEMKSKMAALIAEMDQNEKLTARGRMFKLGSAVLKHRRMSAQEAACRITSIPLIYSTRDVIRLCTLTPDKRMKRAKRNLQDFNSDDTQCFDDDFIDFYHKRPKELESLSLFQFTSWWKKEKNEYKKRSQFVCVRPSHLSMAVDGYFYNLILLHYPHRDEEKLLEGFENARTAFLHYESSGLLNANDLQNDTFTNEIVEAAQRLRVTLQLQELDNSDREDDVQNEMDEGVVDEFMNVNETVQNEPGTSRDVEFNRPDEQLWQNLAVSELTVETLEQNIAKLSSDQLRVFKYIHKVVYSDKRQLLLFLSGNAGTGKTFLLKTLISWIRLTMNKFSGHDPVMIGAPTGCAAKLISGKTLHSLLKLPVQHGGQPMFYHLREVTMRKMRAELGSKMFLIFDETSMISKEMLIHIHRRLCALFQKDSDTCLFGGIHVIASGDFFQLAPVKGKYAFTCPLFDNYVPMFLDQNMRQKDDMAWCELLNRLKLCQLTGEDIKLLDSRVRTKEELLDKDVDIRLYPTKAQVQEYNDYCQNKLKSVTVTLNCTDLFSENDVSAGCSAPPESVPKQDKDTGGLMRKVELSIGSRVMLTRNLGDGLINGSMGNVVQFGYSGRMITTVYVKFDDPESGQMWMDPNVDHAVPIIQVSAEYMYEGRILERIQFPLIPAWAVTHHKAQGLTVDSAVVNVLKTFTAGQVYVALSRVRKLENLYIEDAFKPSKVKVNNDVLQWTLTARQRYEQLKTTLKEYKIPSLLNN